ncbi:hypothetical protein TWF694_000668 [Orbilia ellipsospora]|uniref:N-acetylglucosamine-induced protein 1 n=1 Tax=Orbilia ellipsospora TaxID=2528407 RepID=A0AAV9XPC2_9PEZI
MTMQAPVSAVPIAAPTAFPKNDVYIPTAKDQEILDTPEHLFKLQSWSDLNQIIAENRLEDLKRRPGDLRRYLEWGAETRKEYGSVLKYILTKRLFWEGNLKPRSLVPFEDQEDTEILFNDWPYGLDPGIVHIVVWTKAEIATDPASGDITTESRRIIVDYVNKIFVKDLGFPAENILWFKNWAALQSIRTVEHIHVLVNTNGIEGAMEKLKTVAH